MLDIERFVRLRPRLYHLTSKSNELLIRGTESLIPAAVSLRDAGLSHQITQRRREHLPVETKSGTVLLRDQAPLHENNCELKGGWDFPQLVRELNERVFFWPGDGDGPIDYGLRHFARYASEESTVLSIDTASLFDANKSDVLEFCRYNSGSPRWNAGRASPRGPVTFAGPQSFDGRPGQVIEVVFRGQVKLSGVDVVYTSPNRWISS